MTRYLQRDEQTWRTELETLIERVHRQTASVPSADIEADISTAMNEVREVRRATRRLT